jgi:hypothetical protein
MLYFEADQSHSLTQAIRRFGEGFEMEFDLNEGPWVAGGAARRIFLSEPANCGDIDIFVPEGKDFFVRANFFGLIIKNQYMLGGNKKTTDEKRIAIHNITHLESDGKYQVIESLLMRRMEIENGFLEDVPVPSILPELFKTFDFTVCQFATDGKMIAMTEEAFADSFSRVLRLGEGHGRPVSLNRAHKYSKYGYTVAPGELTKIINLPKKLTYHFFAGY